MPAGPLSPPRPHRPGFTIIELLAAMVVIGVLATIAITKFGTTTERAYLAVMKSDLKNLALMAETRFTSENSYVGLEVPRGSAGVTLTFEGTVNSWRATATHYGVPGTVCVLSSVPGDGTEPTCR